MLSVDSKCKSCRSKKVCKHYDYLNSNPGIEATISECDDYNTDLACGTISIPNAEKIGRPFTWNEPVVAPLKQGVINTTPGRIRDGWNFSEGVTQLKNDGLKIEPVAIKKVTCEICGKEVNEIDAQRCDRCGKLACNNCGSVEIDLETSKPVLTCYQCVPEEKVNEPAMEWTIDNFTEEKDEKEEKKDVKPKRKTTKGPIAKPKK